MLMVKEFFRLTDSIEKRQHCSRSGKRKIFTLHCWTHPDALYQPSLLPLIPICHPMGWISHLPQPLNPNRAWIRVQPGV